MIDKKNNNNGITKKAALSAFLVAAIGFAGTFGYKSYMSGRQPIESATEQEQGENQIFNNKKETLGEPTDVRYDCIDGQYFSLTTFRQTVNLLVDIDDDGNISYRAPGGFAKSGTVGERNILIVGELDEDAVPDKELSDVDMGCTLNINYPIKKITIAGRECVECIMTYQSNENTREVKYVYVPTDNPYLKAKSNDKITAKDGSRYIKLSGQWYRVVDVLNSDKDIYIPTNQADVPYEVLDFATITPEYLDGIPAGTIVERDGMLYYVVTFHEVKPAPEPEIDPETGERKQIAEVGYQLVGNNSKDEMSYQIRETVIAIPLSWAIREGDLKDASQISYKELDSITIGANKF